MLFQKMQDLNVEALLSFGRESKLYSKKNTYISMQENRDFDFLSKCILRATLYNSWLISPFRHLILLHDCLK